MDILQLWNIAATVLIIRKADDIVNIYNIHIYIIYNVHYL